MIKHVINNNETETFIEVRECFVCLHEEINELFIIRLKKQDLYIKKCDCDGLIHTCFLYNCFNINNSCPIFRTRMVRKETTVKENICFIAFIIFIFGSAIYSFFRNINF
jgi:hypothetical protein